MIGAILAGGTGTRLRPMTKVTNKHLLPVYDKPMIAYPLQYLLSAGITEIFVVTGGEHFDAIGRLLGSGKNACEELGLEGKIDSISFGVQDGAGGIAEALGLAKRFAGSDSICVVLGDNIFQDSYFLHDAVRDFKSGGHIFLKNVPDEQLYEEKGGKRRTKYGMAELRNEKVIGIEEKPEKPKSNLVVTGAYIYDNSVFDFVKTLRPSARGELEITDVNNYFVQKGGMRYSAIKGWWTDAGSVETLYRAQELVHKNSKNL